jgi:hypothetical protein
MKRPSLWSRICCGVVLCAIAGSGGAVPTFEYAGIKRETDLSSLRQRYSSSIVDERSVRLSQADSHDDVHYIEKRTVEGKDELRVVFETPHDQLKSKPTSWRAEHYARFPKCNTILARLIRTYGQPAKTRTWPEERLSHRVRTWSNSNEEMSLDCYNIDGKGDLLAAELIRSK